VGGPEARIMLVRHPQTVANAERRFIGRSDSPLTALGVAQRAALAQAVAAFAPLHVFSSPIPRALDAARIAAPPGVAVIVEDDLIEVDFGLAEGLTHSEMAERGIALDYDGPGPVAPGGETLAALEARVARVGARIAAAGARSAVFTHGGVFRRLLGAWLELPREAIWRFSVTNAAVAVIKVADGYATLESFGPALAPEP
jgi:broad specificity phosphatase PhoE